MTCSLRILVAMLLVASACALPRRGVSEESAISWQVFAQGEYVGPAREAHVPEYQLRVDDELEFGYHLTREALSHSYQLEVADVIRIESHIDKALTRDATVQPDGTIDLLYLGPIRVVRRTVEDVAKDLNERYAKFYKVTDINVMRVRTQSRLEDLLAAVNTRHSLSGQGKRVRITPAGTLSLPTIGVVPAQGLSLNEIKREVDARYREAVAGVEVTPILVARAPSYVFVVGEVRHPGRFNLVGPTTTMQSLALAGGWKHSGNLRQIVIFRRAEDWRLLATKIDLGGAFAGDCLSPADDIWLRDGDLVVVPKSSSHWCDEALGHLFGRGDCKVGRNSMIGE